MGILKELAERLRMSVEALDQYFEPARGELQTSSFTEQQRNDVVAALEVSNELHMKLLGPVGFIHSLSGHMYDLAALHAINRFGIATALPLGEQWSFDKLAKETSLEVFDLQRIIRYAATAGIFREPEPGLVEHTACSRQIHEDIAMRARIGLTCDEQLGASAKYTDALALRKEGQVKTAWALANSAEKPMLEELQTRFPRRAKQLNDAMTYMWSRQQPLESLVNGFDWRGLGGGHVVEVGGGFGQVAIAIAEAFPTLNFTVQDFKPVVDQAREKCPQHLRERVAFQAHDFLTPQPTSGDLYLLRSTLHNWPDDKCVDILRNLVPALKDGAKVVINELVMPQPGELSTMEERSQRIFDFAMAVTFGALERDAAGWKSLFEKADHRYHFLGITETPVMTSNPPGLIYRPLALIVAEWRA